MQEKDLPQIPTEGMLEITKTNPEVEAPSSTSELEEDMNELLRRQQELEESFKGFAHQVATAMDSISNSVIHNPGVEEAINTIHGACIAIIRKY